jgi:hypothetical protein
MCTKRWNTESIRRCSLKSRLAAATMLAGVLLLPASARSQPSCLVQVDKQVSCDNGVTWVDQGLVFTNEDGTRSCNGVNATPPGIQVRYVVQNAGGTRLFGCVLDDNNNAFDLDPDGVLITPGTFLEIGATGVLPAPGHPLSRRQRAQHRNGELFLHAGSRR